MLYLWPGWRAHAFWRVPIFADPSSQQNNYLSLCGTPGAHHNTRKPTNHRIRLITDSQSAVHNSKTTMDEHKQYEILTKLFSNAEIPVNKKQIGRYVKEFPINQIFQIAYTEVVLKCLNTPASILLALRTIETMCSCETPKDDELVIRKICQLMFSKQEKEELANIFRQQYPEVDSQEPSSKILYELLMYLFVPSQDIEALSEVAHNR